MAVRIEDREIVQSIAHMLGENIPESPHKTIFFNGPDGAGNQVFVKAKQITEAVQLLEVGIRNPRGELKGSTDLVNGELQLGKKGIVIKDVKNDRLVIGPRLAAIVHPRR